LGSEGKSGFGNEAVWVRKILRVLREENFGPGIEGDMELLGSEMGTGVWPAQTGPNSAS